MPLQRPELIPVRVHRSMHVPIVALSTMSLMMLGACRQHVALDDDGTGRAADRSAIPASDAASDATLPSVGTSRSKGPAAPSATISLAESREPARGKLGVDIAPGVSHFLDCYEVSPGLPSCSGIEPLASGWIAYVAQRSPFHYPSMAHVARLDGDGSSATVDWLVDAHGGADSPVWSPSGRHIAWEAWQPVRPPDRYRESADRPLMFTRLGQPVTLPATAGLNYPSLSTFLSETQTPDGVEALLAYDRASTIAVGLPRGISKRMPVALPGSNRKHSGSHEDWVMGDDGRIAILRFSRLMNPDGPDPNQHLETAERWWDGAWQHRALTGGSPDPDVLLMDWSPSGRHLVGIQGIHVLSNSNWRGPALVIIDAETGTEQMLNIRLSEFGETIMYDRRLRHFDWRPGDGDEMAIVAHPCDDMADFSCSDSRLIIAEIATGAWRIVSGEGQRVTWPVWSPDGRTIAFVAKSDERELPSGWPMLSVQDQHDARRGLALYLLDLETGVQRRLTDPGEGWDSRPQWSSDGSRLLYRRGIDPENWSSGNITHYQVRVVTMDGELDEVILDHIGPDWAWWPGDGGD